MKKHCLHCGRVWVVVQTVSWQADACGVCGHEIKEA